MNSNLSTQQVEKKIQFIVPLLVSLLWVFLSLNYIFCDLLTMMDRNVIRELMDGNIGGIPMTQVFLLLAGISLEIPFLMVVLSAILPYTTNRIVNIGAAALMILYQLASFFIGSELTLHYVFFSMTEILGNAVIIILATRWKR